jgi:hypothetical protein
VKNRRLGIQRKKKKKNNNNNNNNNRQREKKEGQTDRKKAACEKQTPGDLGKKQGPVRIRKNKIQKKKNWKL